MRLEIPVGWAVQGQGIPEVCARHGQPGTKRHQMEVTSQAPGWTWALILLGWFPFWLARLVTKKTIVAKAWPFCDRCIRQQRIALVATSLVTAAGVAAAVAGLVYIDERLPWPLWAVVGGVLVMAIGLGATRWAQWAGVAGVVVDSEVRWLRIRNPHPDFERRFTEAMAREAARAGS